MRRDIYLGRNGWWSPGGLWSVDDESGSLYEGYDDCVWEPPDLHPDLDPGFQYAPLSAEDRATIATHMVERWKRWGGLP